MKTLTITLQILIIPFILAVTTFAFQDRIKSAFTDRGLVTNVYPSYWYPFPTLNSADPQVVMKNAGITRPAIDDFTDTEDYSYALVEIQNNGVTESKPIRIQFKAAPYPALLVVKSEGKSISRTVDLDAKDILVGKIAPGARVQVYMWWRLDWGNSYSTRYMRVFNEDGLIPIKVRTHDDYEYRQFITPWWFDLIETWLPRMLFIGLLLFAGLGFIVARTCYKAMNKLLADETLYQAEKARYEAAPAKYELSPELLK